MLMKAFSIELVKKSLDPFELPKLTAQSVGQEIGHFKRDVAITALARFAANLAQITIPRHGIAPTVHLCGVFCQFNAVFQRVQECVSSGTIPPAPAWRVSGPVQRFCGALKRCRAWLATDNAIIDRCRDTPLFAGVCVPSLARSYAAFKVSWS
jgi:hypothetical protein